MTKVQLMRRVERIPQAEFRRIAPFLEADLAAAEDLDGIRKEVAEGRRSARTKPLIDSKEAFARARSALAR
ncbi:MAG: hypothetical protein AAB215_06710 [Planctomycetota bacterium]